MKAVPRAASASALVALVLAAVWVFWPLALGGSTVYVSTHGISMQPRFHTGDLAILRASDHYAVGDVVAYQSRTLKTTVMHRIVALDGPRFVFKGDNNSWHDPDHPTQDLLLGKLWLRVPQGGKALAALRSPVGLMLVSLVGAVFLGATSTPVRRMRGRRRQGPTRAARAHSLPVRALARQAALVSAGVALAGIAAGAVLLALPDTQKDPLTAQVIQTGQFAYGGTALRGTTYPTGRVQTGDVVYTQLAKSITVTFRDRVTGPGLTVPRGTLRLVVTIATPDGWTGTLTSGATTTVDAGVLDARVLLDPAYATDVMNRHAAEVGASSGSATLTVLPQVTLDGAVQGHSFTAGPPAGISFALSANTLRPASVEPAAFAPTVSTPVKTSSVVPRRIQLLSVGLPIGVARMLDGVVLALSLLVLSIAWWIGRSRTGDDPAETFLMKNAARILPVTRFTPGNTVIDVSDADALHRVAERLDTLVLHRAGPDDHVFAVQDVETTYRFVLPIGPDPATARPAPGPLDETAQLRPVGDGAGTTRLRPVRLAEDTARISRVRRRIPVPPPRTAPV